MLAVLRKKSQITLPKEIVDRLSLQEGDSFEVVESGGLITLTPVVIYPKKKVDAIRGRLEEAKARIAAVE